MTQFLAEVYLPRGDGVVERAAARAADAARALARSGVRVRHVQSIYLPEDETCFLLFEAASEGAVRAAAGWAELICNRVVEAHGADVEERVR